MSLARDDAGNIRELHTKASGLTRNLRDASGGSGGAQTWRQPPTPIQTPGKGLGSNPYSSRMTSGDARKVEGRDRKAGPSSALRTTSSSRPTTKRRKVDLQESKYFPLRRGVQAVQSTSTSTSTSVSSRPNCVTAEAIIIDAEDDAPATNNVPREPFVSRTSSPDPMDVISSDISYAFDQNEPSPMHQFSSSFQGIRKPPKDGESTRRLRNVMKEAESESVSRPDDDGNGDGDDVQPARALLSKSKSTAQTEVSPRQGNVRMKVALFEGRKSDPPHINLLEVKQSRKNGMKPKQPPRDVPALPIQQLDPDATRPSGFVSSSKPSRGKAAGGSNSVRLPLKEWSIGAAIPPQEGVAEPQVNLTWESGVLKVRDANGSTPFELQVKKGSVDNVKYVDIKKTETSEPLIQIHPSVMASAQNHTAHGFKPGSSNSDGFLTFKFDTSASGWDNGVYVRLVQKLIDALVWEDEKSTLDGPAARAVWEAVTRVHEEPPMMSNPEHTILDIPKETPPNPPSKPRPRPKPRSDATTGTEIFVRRSARLSGVEEKRFSPRPDPDEVILGYRSGTGSFNITNGDVGRLKPGEFLNDTLIEFGLKLWLADLQESNPELASQVHVFSSFFYKKLSTKNPEEGYNSVRKWTSKFDLFQKKYIIVPINENLHWYLAIIYFPEYTLLPPPVQVTNLQTRRSTRRLGVVIDFQDTESAPGQSHPPDPDPPPNGNGQIDSVSSIQVVDPDTPRTDDRKDEIDVELMVESAPTPVGPEAKQVDAANMDTLVTQCPDSPELLYPQSSPPRPATLLPSDCQDDRTEQLNHPASAGGSKGNPIQTSGIPPSTFYGTKHQGHDVTPAQLSPADVNAPPEIEIEEGETMGNPESEPEEAAEHPRTYVYTFDSLASKHPQAVKRLSRYLLMEARDKKQLTEDSLTEPKGMQAFVPAQPNFCDCGIYLLHFAKTFMKDPKLSSDIIRGRSSPQKGRRVPHEHWDGASVGSYRDELATRIHSMSEEWKKQRGEQDSGTKSQNADGASAAAPQEQQQQQQQQEQPREDQPPTAPSKAENNDDSDSDIEVLGSPQKVPGPSKALRRVSGVAESRKKGPAARVRG